MIFYLNQLIIKELSESKGKIEDINTKLNNICTTDGDE